LALLEFALSKACRVMSDEGLYCVMFWVRDHNHFPTWSDE
jgi:hypothetical protein